jgi:hypothetical protein
MGLVATCDERGFPIHLAEAIAAGCVELDTEIHRSLVVPRETGYLYTNVREMLERIVNSSIRSSCATGWAKLHGAWQNCAWRSRVLAPVLACSQLDREEATDARSGREIAPVTG